jgi:hypothetical protein
MSVSQTHGYHLVFEIDGNRVGRILDDFIPGTMDFAISTFTAHVAPIPGRPSVVTINAGNSLTIAAARSVTIAGISFNVRITIQTVVNVDASGNINLTYSQPTLVADTPADQTTLQNLVNTANALGGTAYTVAQILQMGATQLLDFLQHGFSLPQVPIGVSFGSGPCAMSLNKLDLHTISGSLFVLLKFAGAGIPASTTNANAFTTSLRGTNHAVMVVANEALLAISTCFISHDPNSPLVGTTFVTSGTCSTQITPHVVSMSGHDIMIAGLNICVSGNHIVLSGGASTSGTGWSASASFNAPIGFDCHSDGTVFPIFDPNSVAINTDISFDWWVYLIGFVIAAVAGIFLGPIAAIVLSIVVACLSAIASMIANAIARNALSGLSDSLNSAVASGFRMVPAQILQLLGDLQCQQVILDDFSLMGTTGSPSGLHLYIYESSEKFTNQVQTGTGGSGFNEYVDYYVANEVVYTASASNFTGAVTYQWRINNNILGNTGNVNMNGKTVQYTVSGNKCTLDTNLGDSVNGAISVKATGTDHYAKSATEVIDISGTHRDYPMEDALQKMLAKLSHMATIQGYPHVGPGPDPDPYSKVAIDLQQNFSTAALKANSLISEITSTREFNQQLGELKAMKFQ